MNYTPIFPLLERLAPAAQLHAGGPLDIFVGPTK